MTQDKRLKYLQGSLWIFGIIFVFGVLSNDDVDLAIRMGGSLASRSMNT